MSASEKEAHTTLPSAAEWVWHQGGFCRLREAVVPITTHSLHYGSAVFEGIRFYETKKGPAVFRLDDHLARFEMSARTMGMRLEYTMEGYAEVIAALIRKNELLSGYIRTIAYFGEGISLTRDDLETCVSIFLLPWPVHQSKEVIRLGISEFEKPSPASTVHAAKIAGHYVNSYLAALSVPRPRFSGALLMDWQGRVAETPVANIFGVRNGKLFTPGVNSILPGITRDTVLQLAPPLHLEAYERSVSLQELQYADEVFITGTAAEIAPVGAIDDVQIGEGTRGPITTVLTRAFDDCVRGINEPPAPGWLTYV